MCFDAVSKVVRITNLKPSAKWVLYYLAEAKNPETGECLISQKELTAKSGVVNATLNTQLTNLERLGLIGREARFSADGARLTTSYTINL